MDVRRQKENTLVLMHDELVLIYVTLADSEFPRCSAAHRCLCLKCLFRGKGYSRGFRDDEKHIAEAEQLD
jgi:hypothetical protein